MEIVKTMPEVQDNIYTYLFQLGVEVFELTENDPADLPEDRTCKTEYILEELLYLNKINGLCRDILFVYWDEFSRWALFFHFDPNSVENFQVSVLIPDEDMTYSHVIFNIPELISTPSLELKQVTDLLNSDLYANNPYLNLQTIADISQEILDLRAIIITSLYDSGDI